MSATLHLLARVGGRPVMFPAAAIDSVVDLPQVVPAPGAPFAVRGLTALRSRIATVIDVGRIFGLAGGDPASDAPPGRKGVVVVVEGHLYVLAVEALGDLADHVVQPLPAGFARNYAWATALGVAQAEGATVPVFDPAAIVARAAKSVQAAAP